MASPKPLRDRRWVRYAGFALLYEKVITGVSKVMKNVPRKEVATQVDISGWLDNSQTSTVQAIVKLIQTAFFKAILPGFHREVRGSGGSE